MKVAVVQLPYNTSGKEVGGAAGPKAIVDSGLLVELEQNGHIIAEQAVAHLTKEEEAQYGGWNRVALAGGNLAGVVHDIRSKHEDTFVLGLLADCNGVLGMLGGLQRSVHHPYWPNRVGLVWVDAHGDYNTPETSPSGMLGGMPVAVASGKTMHRFRKNNGLEHPLQAPDIVMMGLRDLDALERQMVEEDNLVTLTEHDLITKSDKLHQVMERLCAREDLVYVHVDLDILDPEVAPAAGLPSPGGLTGEQLGEALKTMLSYPNVGALALVSYSPARDKDQGTLAEVKKAIVIAMEGLKLRS